ncbi:DUF3644 domain-containing protein [Vibrio parahaemolyticus]|uniref:DUF3644 domain-containing protein n=2 Tax=Vibrio parahaemolyticus TaxID=670 RepID=UPI001654F829|nr:DUF3644 domain-containing protein [Vibrio parahaemolyticus]MBC8655917.1 DUF3644 domain-containing protein [Vibrio parahaemolyticus]
MSRDTAQKNFFEFLQKKQLLQKAFTKQEVIDANGWKASTFKSYFGKGQITQFLTFLGDDKYEAVNTLDINFIEFKKRLSQSKHYQELGHRCKSNLAKALIKKSRDNMMLALELYNRPSLENKLDGFVMLFSTAWEQLLKSMIIEAEGELAIYSNPTKKGIKQTIPLRKCLDKIFNHTDNIRKNVELIAGWRDDAVHLLIPELQGLASRVFQSGVINYSTKFEDFTEVPFLQSQHSGMISLVGDFKLPPKTLLTSYYGQAAEDILELAKTVEHEIEQANDIEFAIPINVSLVYAQDDEQGQVIIAKANGKSNDIEQLRNALIVQKAVDPEKSHMYSQNSAIRAINEQLKKFSAEKLSRSLVARDKKGELTFNSNCFQAVVERLNWKKNNNEFHHFQAMANKHIYSQQAVEEIVSRITENERYLQQAKDKLNKRVKQKV